MREQLLHNHDDAPSCSCSHEEHNHSCGCSHEKSENKFILYGGLLISLISLILGYFDFKLFRISINYIPIIICGYGIVLDGLKSLFIDRKITTNLLITIALIAAVAIGEVFAAAEIAFIMVIGEMLEEYTLKKANKGLEKLISYAPTTAHLAYENRDINAKDLKVGDIVIIKNGETVPIDGEVVDGQTYIDQSMMTGENLPVYKTVGDSVYEGSLNCDGAIYVKATKVGKDSTLSKMIELVKKAQSQKADSVRITDKIAGYIVPISVLTSLLVFLITKDIVRAVTILVVFCPCTLVLSTPTAIMACIGKATKMGVLIKTGQAVELVSKADGIIMDKTGTITHGKMEVCKVFGDFNQVVCCAAKAEQFSTHPIAKAIIEYANKHNISYDNENNFKNISGKGIINGDVAIGNSKLLYDLNINLTKDYEEKYREFKDLGTTALFVCKENKVIGIIALEDKIKEQSKNAVKELNSLGIKNIILATGDNQIYADKVAHNVGIKEVYADLMPEDKVEIISKYQNQNRRVIMVGDGVNDAPALAKADIGIAMGAIGSDVAIETADIALMNDNIDLIPKIIKLSRNTRSTIMVNILLSVILSIGAVLLASFGMISPVVGALVHNLGSVAVVINSILLFYKKI